MWTAVQAQDATEGTQTAQGWWLMWPQVAAARAEAVVWWPRVREQSDWGKQSRNMATFSVSDYAKMLVKAVIVTELL